MSGPLNSVLSDPTPFQAPKVQKLSKPKRQPKSDWEKFGKSARYKDVEAYLETRKTYWQHFLPGGESLAELILKDKEAALLQVGIATGVIAEIEDLLLKVKLETPKKKK